jgi:hypothetical protein
LRNDGTAALLIHDVRSSCGCTTGEPQRRIIAPGETVPLLLALDTRGREGEYRGTVRILSNDPHRPSVAIEIHATIAPRFRGIPHVLRFDGISRGEVRTQSICVESCEGEPLSVASYADDDKALRLTTRCRRKTGTSNTFLIDVSVSALKTGFCSGRIVIREGDTTRQVPAACVVPIEVSATGPVEIGPRHLFFVLSGDVLDRKTVILQSKSPSSGGLVIEEARYDPDWLEVTICNEPSGPAKLLVGVRRQAPVRQTSATEICVSGLCGSERFAVKVPVTLLCNRMTGSSR